MNNQPPFIRAEGTHREMGRQIGQQLRDQIRRFIEFIIGDTPKSEAMHRAGLYLPVFQKHCPDLLEEIRGVAEGADISVEEALTPNIRGGINRIGGCTAFVISSKITTHGMTLIGQNQDLPAEMRDMGVIMHLIPKVGPRMLMWSFAGLIGYHGMNDTELAFFCNSVPESDDSEPIPADRIMPGYMVKRLMLEQSSIDGVRKTIESMGALQSPYGQANYVLSDREGITDIELHRDGYVELEDGGKGFIAHTNHYVSAELKHLNRYTLPSLIRADHESDSIPRLKRMNRLLDEANGQISVESLKRILCDHQNYPYSICRHPDQDQKSVTVASIIAEPAAKRMHLCLGNPCRNDFHVYEM